METRAITSGRVKAALTVLLCSYLACQAPAPVVVNPLGIPGVGEWIEGEYLLRTTDSAVPADVTAMIAGVHGQILHAYTLVERLYHFRSAVPPQQVLLLAAHPLVEYVYPNRTLHLAAQGTPDPGFFRQWALSNMGQIFKPEAVPPLAGTAGADIGQQSSSLGTGVPVAVIDTGLATGHPDIAGNLWRNPAEAMGLVGVDDDANGLVDDVSGWDFIDGDANPLDAHGHGTAVASILAAVGDNGTGMKGVAPECRIVPVRAFGNVYGSGVGDVARVVEALEYVVGLGVKVSCNSFGEPVTASSAPSYLPLLSAITNAGAAGHLFVTAAGNHGPPGTGGGGVDIGMHAFLPASYALPNMLVVTGIDYYDQFMGLNWSETLVNLAAPGKEIFAATDLGSGYGYQIAGTSFAVPHVAGAAALYWANFPTSSMDKVRKKILDTVRPVPALTGKVTSGGALDVSGLFTLPSIMWIYVPLYLHWWDWVWIIGPRPWLKPTPVEAGAAQR